MLIGLAVSAAATAVLGVVPTLPLFLAASLVAGLGSGLLNPPLNAAVADVVGAERRGGTVLAGFQMASDVGAIVGPLAAGAVAQILGFGAAFGLTGLVTALALALWLRAPETPAARGAASRSARQPADTPISEPTRYVAPAAIAPNNSCRPPLNHHGLSVNRDVTAPTMNRPTAPTNRLTASDEPPSR